MAHFVTSGSKGFSASVDIPLGTAVKLTAAKTVGISTAATDRTIGFVSETVKAGRIANVRMRNAEGTVNAIAGGTIAVGDKLVVTTAGQVITATQAAAAAQPVNEAVGISLEAATAGQIIEILPLNYVY